MNYLEYQRVMNVIASAEVRVLLASDKKGTGDYLNQLLPIAILGINLTEEEPRFDIPTEAVHWKINQLMEGNSNFRGDPSETVIFASDVVASDGVDLFHQDFREGFLGSTNKTDIRRTIENLRSGDSLSIVEEERYYVGLIIQDAIARIDLWEREALSPEDRMWQRFENKTYFYWDCAFGYQSDEGKRVTTSVRIGVNLQRPLTREEVTTNYNSKINMGLDLVGLATEQGADFFIETETDRFPLTPEQAYTLIVTKAPLAEILLEMMTAMEGELTVEPWVYLGLVPVRK